MQTLSRYEISRLTARNDRAFGKTSSVSCVDAHLNAPGTRLHPNAIAAIRIAAALNSLGMTTTPIISAHFNKALNDMLDETFDRVNGFYLDRGTALIETLADVTAEEASIPVGGKCATLAAQVKHTAFYLENLERVVRSGQFERVDWNEIWNSTRAVDAAEWSDIKSRLAAARDLVRALIRDTTVWPSEREIGGAIAMIAHTAYHLGEIRQALCIIRPDR